MKRLLFLCIFFSTQFLLGQDLLDSPDFERDSLASIQNLSPKNFAVVPNLSLTLQWKKLDKGPNIIYKIYVWEANLDGIRRQYTLSTNHIFYLKELRPNTNYFWKITATDINSKEQYTSDTWQFRTSKKAKKRLSTKDLKILYAENFSKAYISEINPQITRLGDTIIIHGAYFGQNKKLSRLKIGNNELEVISQEHDKIITKVPEKLALNLNLKLGKEIIKSPEPLYIKQRKSNIYLDSVRTSMSDSREINFSQIEGFDRWFHQKVMDTLNHMWQDFLELKFEDSLQSLSRFLDDSTLLIPDDSLTNIYAPIALIQGRLDDLWDKMIQSKIQDTLTGFIKEFSQYKAKLGLKSSDPFSSLTIGDVNLKTNLDQIWSDVIQKQVGDSISKLNPNFFQRQAFVKTGTDTIAHILLPTLELNERLNTMWNEIVEERLMDSINNFDAEYTYDTIKIYRNKINLRNVKIPEELLEEKLKEQLTNGKITLPEKCDCEVLDSLENLGLGDSFSVKDVDPILGIYGANSNLLEADTIADFIGQYLVRAKTREKARLADIEKARLAAKAEAKRIAEEKMAEARRKLEEELDRQMIAQQNDLDKTIEEMTAEAERLDSLEIALNDSIRIEHEILNFSRDTSTIRYYAKLKPIYQRIFESVNLVMEDFTEVELKSEFIPKFGSMYSKNIEKLDQRFNGETFGNR